MLRRRFALSFRLIRGTLNQRRQSAMDASQTDSTAPAYPVMPAMASAAVLLVQQCEAAALIPAIGVLEAAPTITVEVLRNMGITLGQGVPLRELVGVGKAQKRDAIVAQLLASDPRLARLVDTGEVGASRAASALACGRTVLSLVEEACRPPAPVAVANAAALPQTIIVDTDDDRGYSDHNMVMSEVQRLMAALVTMCNTHVRSFLMPSMGVMKKVGYWIRMNRTFPDPARLPLKQFYKEGTESIYLGFRRMVVACYVSAAGQVVAPGERDDGAGALAGFQAQWFSAQVGEAFLAECEEGYEKAGARQFERLVPVMYAQLFKGTAEGRMSGSLTARQAISTMAPQVGMLQLMAAGTTSESTPKKRKQAARATTPGGGGGGGGGSSGKKSKKEKGGKFEDKEGVLGPNGKARKVGGNPDGEACKGHASADGCKFTTCSFSHA